MMFTYNLERTLYYPLLNGSHNCIDEEHSYWW